MVTEPKQPLTIYLCYAQKDEELKLEFENYLATLQQVQYISGWVERQVQRGTDWSQVIDPRLQTAGILLLLLSPDLLGSGYCSGAEMREALNMHREGKMRIIPVMLRRVDIGGLPIQMLQTLPRNGKPIVTWPDRDDAWWDVDHGIRHVVQEYRFRKDYG
jgi:hypothetical protein